MRFVTIHAAKTNLSKLVGRVLAGEEIVIARGSEPVARLVPLEHAASKRKFGALRGKVTVPKSFFEPLPEAELLHWEK
jgi:prevent-host-death family protein